MQDNNKRNKKTATSEQAIDGNTTIDEWTATDDERERKSRRTKKRQTADGQQQPTKGSTTGN